MGNLITLKSRIFTYSCLPPDRRIEGNRRPPITIPGFVGVHGELKFDEAGVTRHMTTWSWIRIDCQTQFDADGSKIEMTPREDAEYVDISSESDISRKMDGEARGA